MPQMDGLGPERAGVGQVGEAGRQVDRPLENLRPEMQMSWRWKREKRAR